MITLTHRSWRKKGNFSTTSDTRGRSWVIHQCRLENVASMSLLTVFDFGFLFPNSSLSLKDALSNSSSVSESHPDRSAQRRWRLAALGLAWHSSSSSTASTLSFLFPDFLWFFITHSYGAFQQARVFHYMFTWWMPANIHKYEDVHQPCLWISSYLTNAAHTHPCDWKLQW